MEIKLFEVRDAATFMPVMVTKLISRNIKESYLMSHVGLNKPGLFSFLYTVLNTGESSLDAYDWHNRTRKISHQFIEANWDQLFSGQVIDVEFILGETKEPKISEMSTLLEGW